MKKKIKYPVVATLREGAVDILIKLLDGSKLGATIPRDRIQWDRSEPAEGTWDSGYVVLMCKDGIAKIMGTEYWTWERNVLS